MAIDYRTLSLTGEPVRNDRSSLAPVPRPAAAASSSDTEQMVSLTDLAARGLTLEWFEAVAIVQGLCEAIIETGNNSAPAKPDLNDIYIDSAGGVAAASDGPQPPTAAVRCVGEVLSKILPSNDFMNLRSRIVPKAASPTPFYASVKELSDALAYYERPNRYQIIQAVFERWQTLPPPIVPVQPRSNDVDVLKRKVRRPRGATTSKWLQVAGAVLLFVAAGGAIITWAVKTAPLSSESDDDTLTYSNDGSGRAEAEEPSQRTVDSRAKPGKASEPVRAEVPQRAPVTPRFLYRPDQPVTEISDRNPNPGATLSESADSVPETAAPTPAVSEIRPPAPVGTAAIYKADDRGITPPKVVYPQSLIPSTGARREDVLIVEVILNEAGKVDSAKAIDLPRTLGESLVLTNALAATKTWRFHPALKDGQPVRYRELIAVAIH
ncbi:MAG: hypothetical protein C5B57_03635 [Blastocatellia bacterium]|nr:MAG: hypothetical protein C5B57_03635 [Blastocatellia bacterium]